jgi:hypothetical protein
MMPLKKGKKPALVVHEVKLGKLIAAMIASGYVDHDGRKSRIKGEVATLRKEFHSGSQRRQNHVQIIFNDDGMLHVYAHTEPFMGRNVKDLILHGISVLFDGASYQAGARMLKKDINGLF